MMQRHESLAVALLAKSLGALTVKVEALEAEVAANRSEVARLSRELRKAKSVRGSVPTRLQTIENRQAVIHKLIRVAMDQAGVEMSVDEDLAIREDMSTPKIMEIAEAVSKRFGIPVAEIVAHNRTPAVVLARQQIMWIAHKSGHSLPKIGRVLHRHHSTVLHGIKAEEARRAQ